MLSCVVNISEGRRGEALSAVVAAAGDHLLDLHSDAFHNRSVLTLAGPEVEPVVFAVAATAVGRLDLAHHIGAHPRLGVVDVVPFVALPSTGSAPADAVAARDRFARRAGTELDLPCFLYGPERNLPEVRRQAFVSLAPDTGPRTAHPSAGATCVGARPLLVAYNLWLAGGATLDQARAVVRTLRSPDLRALAFVLDGVVQVSCNLLAPLRVGPQAVFDAVASQVAVARAELVGLVPGAALTTIPAHRWGELDLDPSRTIEARLSQAGLDGGRS